jgi:hypothetical protein
MHTIIFLDVYMQIICIGTESLQEAQRGDFIHDSESILRIVGDSEIFHICRPENILLKAVNQLFRTVLP